MMRLYRIRHSVAARSFSAEKIPKNYRCQQPKNLLMWAPNQRVNYGGIMDNKYALGGTKVAHEHHDAKLKSTHPPPHCRFCMSVQLIYNATLDDHLCDECGQYQEDMPKGYSSGRSSNY